MPPATPSRTRSNPPKRRRPRRLRLDLSGVTGLVLRRRGFWVGAGGLATTITIMGLVVALLFGWVLLWLNQAEGPNYTLLIIGCVVFALVLGLLATLQNRLAAHWRLRAAEAAFLAGFSHSFRTPISAIRAAAQALQGPGLTEDDRTRLLASIVRETRRLGLRVDNVLETSRLEVERKAFTKETVALDLLVTRLASEARPVVEGRGGSLSVSVEPGLEVTGDGRALRLMIENLLDNALKFSGDDPFLRVELRAEGDFALVVVSDEGCGFDPEERTFLLKRFRSGDGARAGSGIGLAIARAVARGHGGELHLDSDGPDEGATVEVWLPRRRGAR